MSLPASRSSALLIRLSSAGTRGYRSLCTTFSVGSADHLRTNSPFLAPMSFEAMDFLGTASWCGDVSFSDFLFWRN